MTVQITVRLPDDLVAFVDELVSTERETSRASAVATALRHERRKQSAERDAAIYAATEPDPDTENLLSWASLHPVDLGDS